MSKPFRARINPENDPLNRTAGVINAMVNKSAESIDPAQEEKLQAEIRTYQKQLEESLEAQIQAEDKYKQLQAELNRSMSRLGELQIQLTQVRQEVDTWKNRAVEAEQRLNEYAPLDRELLAVQQQLVQVGKAYAAEQTAHKQSRERIANLERHILQLKGALNLVPGSPPPKASAIRERTRVDLPPFLKS